MNNITGAKALGTLKKCAVCQKWARHQPSACPDWGQSHYCVECFKREEAREQRRYEAGERFIAAQQRKYAEVLSMHSYASRYRAAYDEAHAAGFTHAESESFAQLEAQSALHPGR